MDGDAEPVRGEVFHDGAADPPRAAGHQNVCCHVDSLRMTYCR
jgi:hypothetical protein